MARLIVSVLVSVDGRYRGPGGDLSVLPFDDAFNVHNLALLESAGTLVYGGRWFRENQEHWRAVAADPSKSARDHHAARLVTSLDSLVISDSFTIDPGDPWAGQARVVPRAEGPAEVRRLKAAGAGDLVMFGSGTTWGPLLRAGVVDELVVLVGAGLAGSGDALYSGPPAGLRLVDAEVIAGSPVVRLRYTPEGRS